MTLILPALRWHSATTCNVKVVLPEDSGPKISTTLPLGNPPTPKAISKPIEPVDMVSMFGIVLPSPKPPVNPKVVCIYLS